MLTIEETRQRLAVSRHTVLSLIEKGELRAIKVGQQWRIKPEWIDEYIAEAERASHGQTALSRERHRATA